VDFADLKPARRIQPEDLARFHVQCLAGVFWGIAALGSYVAMINWVAHYHTGGNGFAIATFCLSVAAVGHFFVAYLLHRQRHVRWQLRVAPSLVPGVPALWFFLLFFTHLVRYWIGG
jgi:hypothetical protein